MTTPIYSEGTPSERADLIGLLSGQELKRLVRYSWLPEDEAVEEYEIEKDQLFSLTTGPLLMYFSSGLTVGFSSDPSKNSVVLWVEKNEGGEVIEGLSENDEELFSIDANNQSSYWNEFLGKKIASLRVIHRKANTAKLAELVNEVGLIIIFEDESEFLLSHGLHDNSDDFSVIRKEQITRELLSQLDV